MKKIISLILLLLWMILIFNFSAMDGKASHTRSNKIVRSVIENRVATPTAETVENVVSIDELESLKSDELNINENAKKQKVNKANEAKINKLVSKYDEPIRKLAHVFEYFVLILLMMNFIFQVVKNKRVLCYIIGIVLCLLYAGLDEFHQSHVTGRVGQARDVWVDCVGVLIGLVVVVVVQWVGRRVRKAEE